MKESEIIIVDNIPAQIYYTIIKDSVMYALISFPFTINRMSFDDIEKRIENIAKGKIAEKLFEFYCHENLIPVDFKLTTTPFYQTDKRDFLFEGYEWDIKNNFIHHNGNRLTEFRYKDLPALIPDKHSKDQWSKRNQIYFNNSKGVRFLFTFLKSTDKDSHRQFIEVKLSEKQKDFLNILNKKYKGESFDEVPFDENWFWNKMKEFKDDIPSLVIHDLPNLVITGYADHDLWNQFMPTNSGDDKNFIGYKNPQWYQIIKKGDKQLLKFMNGTIWTRIQNATLPVSKLKSFLKVFEN